jgi:hypothetical protein
MNRRMALLSTLALGGFAASSPAQQTKPRPRLAADPSEPSFRPENNEGFDPPTGFSEPGHKWGIFNISRYTELDHSEDTEHPESALVDWIFRATGSSVWHGEALAAISASKSQLRVYNDAKTLEQVKQVVTRFIDPLFDQMTLRVRVVVAADPRWRYAVYSQLEPKATGPLGQQVWLVDLSTAEMAMAQMSISQSFRKLYDKRHQMINGQTLFVKLGLDRNYVSGLDRASTSTLGFEPKVSKLEEGVELRLSPLLNYDGTAVDLALDLKAIAVRKLHATRVIAPRRIGPAEMSVDIPEIACSRLNQPIESWLLDRSLVISAGVLPGILEEKTGMFSNVRFPGTGPAPTELLVILDLSTRLGGNRDSDDSDDSSKRSGDEERSNFSELDDSLSQP